MKKINYHHCLVFIFVFPLLTSCAKLNNSLGLYNGYGVEELSTSYVDDKDKLLLNTLQTQKKTVVNSDGTTKEVPFLSPFCINGSVLVGKQQQECTALRTVIIGDLMSMSNKICEDHKRSIWGNEASFNLIASTLTNMFSGAATVVTGGTGQAALAALALFSNAERSLGNETVYKNMLVHAIVQKITEKRLELKNVISTKIISNATAKNYYDYPINLAITDVTEYHNTCSFMYGLELAIQEGTNDKKPQKIAELQNLLTSLSIQIDRREDFLRHEKTKDNTITSATDLRLTSLKSRYTSALTRLEALESDSSVPAKPIKPDVTPVDPKT